MMLPPNNGLLIFDLDDTLIDTSDVYWKAKQSFIQVLSNKIDSVTKEYIDNCFEEIDTHNLILMGHAPERYGKSMLDTYVLFQNKKYLPYDKEIENAIIEAGKVIINNVPELIAGALDLLKWCKKRYTLALITRGEKELQQKKLKHYSLEHYFQIIDIVAKKSDTNFLEIIKTLGYHRRDTWVIGDSLKSEIEIGLQLELNCIYFNYTHPTYHWIQERNYSLATPHFFFSVDRLNEIPAILSNKTSI